MSEIKEGGMEAQRVDRQIRRSETGRIKSTRKPQ